MPTAMAGGTAQFKRHWLPSSLMMDSAIATMP